MPAISASMKTFLESDGFEDAVRHARAFNSVRRQHQGSHGTILLG